MDVEATIIGQAPVNNKDWIKQREQSLKDIIFNKQYRKLKMLMQDIEKKNIEEHKKNPEKWVEDKYGKDLFNEK